MPKYADFMQYISPLSMLGTLNDGEADKKSISLAKKKMLAELELNEGGTLTLDGNELTKNDIINLFDALQQNNELSYHVVVAKDPVLQKFLSQNNLQPSEYFNKSALYSDAAFIEWLSPYYFTAFTSLGNTAISGLDCATWETLFANPLLMNGYYTELAWDFFEKELTVDLNRLENVEKGTEPFDETLVSVLCDLNYVKIMRKLPADRFGSFWDHYAFAMMNASVYVFNKGHRGTASIYMDNARLLAFSTELKDGISKKQAEMDFIVSNAPKSGTKNNNYWSIRVIVFILFMILKIATCSHNSYSAPYFNKQHIDLNGQRTDTSKASDSFIYRIQALKTGGTASTALINALPSNKDSVEVKHLKK